MTMPRSREDAHSEMEDIRQRANRFQSIFANSTLGIFQSSLEGRFLMVNPAFARILGYDDPEDHGVEFLPPLMNISFWLLVSFDHTFR